MAEPVPGRRRPVPVWTVAASVAVAMAANVLTGPAATVVVLALGLLAVVAAHRWPRVDQTARRLLTRSVPVLLGWLVLVVLLDAAVGTAWDRIMGDDDEQDVGLVLGPDLPPSADPRSEVAAYDGQPWVQRYFAEFDTLRYGYVPYLGPRVEPVAGRYINSRDGIRRSYEPVGADGPDALEVWFFGGSTMWGEGQRDLHTIPSEVARLAEADGVTLRVRNYGERGYTAFQEFLLFEQELEARGAPDLAVFYDGVNELGTQTETAANLSEQPTVFQLETWMGALERAPALPGAAAPAEPSVWADYAETSAVHKVTRRLGIDPADAQEMPTIAPGDQVVDNAAEIYRRSVALHRHLARHHDTPIVNYWQPGRFEDSSYREVAARIPAGVVDLTEAFRVAGDEDLIYIDGAHTNELGARIAAEAIWADLAPRLDELVTS